jgi:phospholipase/lecithinase/hemolysin
MGAPALEFSPYAMTHKASTDNLKQNIIDFNVALEEEVLDWHDTFNNNVEFFDTYLVFSDLLGDPSIANIDNVDDAYWHKCQGKCNENIDNYLWWDTVHVTGAGHKAISNTIQSKEFFNLRASSVAQDDSKQSLDSSVDEITGLPKAYTRCLSWIILGAILLMMFYMFRHNRVFVSLKKIFQTKAFPNNRSAREYTLV